MPQKKPEPRQDYQALNLELDAVLAQLQAADVPVDEALVLYERGLVLAEQIERHVRAAENTIERLELKAAEITPDTAPPALKSGGRGSKAGA